MAHWLTNPASRALRTMIVLLGIVIGQSILYGPSLTGTKVLLPLGLLAQPNIYLPRTEAVQEIVARTPMMSDLVYFYEPERQFIHRELMAGRFPLWTPYRFSGDPVFPMSFSPLWWPAYLIASPVVLAWTQMLVAVAAGTGAYVFGREILRISFWPAVVMSWTYPLTGAFIIWQGFWLTSVVCWLPWVLLAVDRTIRHPRSWGGPVLGLLTAVAIVSGMLDIAGQLCLTSGIYAIWCFIDEYGLRRPTRRSIESASAVVSAWAIGIAATAWLLLPFIAYVNTGARMQKRGGGYEERPPVGWAALPRLVVPLMNGEVRDGSFVVGPTDLPESAAQGYAGLFAMLVLAPLAWRSRQHRSINIFWIVMGFIAVSWSLNVPGMVAILRLPGLNMMSHSRFVFVISFAGIAMAAVGVEALLRKEITRHWSLVVPIVVLTMLLAWVISRSLSTPEPLATQLFAAIDHNVPVPGIQDRDDVIRAQQNYFQVCIESAIVCGIAIAFWIALIVRPQAGACLGGIAALLLFMELIHFGFGHSSQRRPDMYYPPIDFLQKIAANSSGRIFGFGCLPANLSQVVGLRDVRGYDGIEPRRMTELLHASADMTNSSIFPYALSQFLAPKLRFDRSGNCRVHPILDMLNVVYVIVRGTPPKGVAPDLVGVDYYALINRNALPRVFVPSTVSVASDPSDRLRRLADNRFNPRGLALVEQPVPLPAFCQGAAWIVDEIPTRVNISLQLETPSLVILADQWDRGWSAYLDGVKVPILRVNHALRGVIASPQNRTLMYHYEPPGLYRGMMISSFAVVGLIAWMILALAWRPQ